MALFSNFYHVPVDRFPFANTAFLSHWCMDAHWDCLRTRTSGRKQNSLAKNQQLWPPINGRDYDKWRHVSATSSLYSHTKDQPKCQSHRTYRSSHANSDNSRWENLQPNCQQLPQTAYKKNKEWKKKHKKVARARAWMNLILNMIAIVVRRVTVVIIRAWQLCVVWIINLKITHNQPTKCANQRL